MLGRILLLDYHHYRALALAACYREAPRSSRQEYLEQIQAHQHQLADWAASCPETFQPVGADGVRGAGAPARETRSGHAGLRGGDPGGPHAWADPARGARQRAGRALLEGARLLDHRHLLCPPGPRGLQPVGRRGQGAAHGRAVAPPGRQVHGQPRTPPYDSGPTTQLDALSLVKAQQAISSEINLQTLVSTLMRVALQSAGAQRGALVLSQGDELQVQAVVDGLPERPGTGRRSTDQGCPGRCSPTWAHRRACPHRRHRPAPSVLLGALLPQARRAPLLCLPLTRNQQLRGDAVPGELAGPRRLQPRPHRPAAAPGLARRHLPGERAALRRGAAGRGRPAPANETWRCAWTSGRAS